MGFEYQDCQDAFQMGRISVESAAEWFVDKVWKINDWLYKPCQYRYDKITYLLFVCLPGVQQILKETCQN